jgi:hypothetical protein
MVPMSIYVRSILAVVHVSLGGGRDGDLLRQRWPYLVAADGGAPPRGLRRLLRWAQATPSRFAAALRGTWARAARPARRGRAAGAGAWGGPADTVAVLTGRGVRDFLMRRRSARDHGHGRSVAV